MKTYVFCIHLTLCGETTYSFHNVLADNYQKAYGSLLNEIPHNYSYDYFRVDPVYFVNGKRRISK